MNQITTLNDGYKQQFRYVISGYDAVEITLEFRPQQYSWFMNVVFGNFQVYNERVAISPNLLRQFKNKIPFGILVTGPDAIDPFANDSWLNGWNFYMLDQADILDIESTLYVR